MTRLGTEGDRSDPAFRDGKVTRSFDDWRLEDRYLRAFSRLGLVFAREGYQRLWDEITRQPSDGEGPDQSDLMDEATDGFTHWQYEQIHLSAALRDAVTMFDLYLEKALAEMVEWHGYRVRLPERSRWPDHLRESWRVLAAVDVAPPAVRDVRNRRNWLAHQRGELRTDEQRQRYDTGEFLFPDVALRLTPVGVTADMDALAAFVAEADLAAYRLSWGGERVTEAVLEAALGAVRWSVARAN